MPTVVIIHAAEDTLPARALAEKLRQAKVEVSLELPSGPDLRAAIQSAAATIALWSPRAVAQAGFGDDAAFAASLEKLVHATMQGATPPPQFSGQRSVNLTGWRGEDDFAPWRDLAEIVVRTVGVAPLPPPAPRAASGFFQPGRNPSAGAPPAAASAPPTRQQPQQRQAQPPRPAPAPRPAPPPRTESAPAPKTDEPKRGGGMAMIAIAAVVAVGAIGAGGYWFLNRDAATSAETVTFDDVDLGSAEALRAFISSTRSNAERAQAEEALVTLEQQSLDAARDANTIEAFEAFLRDFPESEEAIFVQGQIQELRLQEANTPAAPATTEAPPTGETTEPNPDLVPPNTTPDASGGGPAQLTPPDPAPAEPPAQPPT